MTRYCIIGAGACGLAVAKIFADRGIPFDCFEALADVGGIWNQKSPHAVYASTYFNSSKKMSRFADFDFPEGLPHYISAAEAEEYLRSYAKTFGLYDRITFNAPVTKAERVDGRWRIEIEGEAKPRFYDGLVVANGHHWEPNVPTYPGRFDGEMLHSHDVKSKEQLLGKRVLVVGAGNSAVDILDDAAHEGLRPVHSMRRSYYFFPKLVLGKPTDAFIDKTSRWPLPRSVMRYLYWWGIRITVGSHWKYDLPAPDHKLFEQHPTACTLYLDHIVHGRITTKPGIERLEGKRVHFVDGTSGEFDLVIWATGFRPHFPFMDSRLILDDQGRSKLFIHTFHREFDDLFVAGLFEPAEGGVWQLADYQGKVIASFIVALETDPGRARWFHDLKATGHPDIGHGIPYKDTPWHKFEIHHYRFKRYMEWLLKKFGATSTLPFPQGEPAKAKPKNEAKLELAS